MNAQNKIDGESQKPSIPTLANTYIANNTPSETIHTI